MPTLHFDKKPINFMALDESLREQFPEFFNGLSTSADHIVVHLNQEPSADERSQIKQIVSNHDAQVLTARQQKQKQRWQRLVQMRQVNADDLVDVNRFRSEKGIIRQLAEKVARLELEVMAMRGELRMPSREE